MKIKICGMGTPENIIDVAGLKPDYLGFIFFEKSVRNFTGEMPVLNASIKKTGVFVDASFDFVKEKVEEFDFQAVQLHGKESSDFCRKVKRLGIEVFKVFSVKSDFDFTRLNEYEGIVDCFLFDTKGEHPGGNGKTFDWQVLKNYNSQTPFILSGGIGMDEVNEVREITRSGLPIHALDLNSKFENKPAEKNIERLKEFLNKIKVNSQ